MALGKYNVLIVDDEFLARKLLVGYVSKIDSLNLVAQCSSALEAMTFIQREKIDILLLDIQMPDITGLDLLKNMQNPLSVIFITAYSEYAIDSYDMGVVDYLLKPVAFPRFFQSINKAIERIVVKNNQNLVVETISTTVDSSMVKPANEFLTVKANYKIYKINFDDLIFIEGQHEYVTFNTSNRRITALYSLKNLEEQLPKDRFVRVHKSFIVSFYHIEDIEGNVVTVSGNKVPIGGSYKDDLLNRLQMK